MWRGREIVWCAAVLLAGNYTGGFFVIDPYLCFGASATISALALYFRRWHLILTAFFCIGITGIEVELMRPVGEKSAFSTRCSAMQRSASSFFEKILDPNGEAEELSLVKALSVGDKSGLSRGTKADFRASGATHLLALSGLHVGIIYKLFGWMLSVLGGAGWARALKGCITLGFLWVFAAVTGLSPSISRAVLMITVYEVGAMAGRRTDGLNSLAASAILITLFSPRAPWEISFQMSFCACLSIFTVFPRLRSLLDTKSWLLNFMWDSATLAISCQMTTGILAYLYFGSFPKYFIICNLLTVPLVGMIMFLIVASVLTSGIPQVGSCIADVLAFSLHMLRYVVSVISEMNL